MNNKDLKIYLKDDKFIVTGDVTDEAELLKHLGKYTHIHEYGMPTHHGPIE